MIEIFHSIVLGAVQGITEFLPISSSAHLVLVPYLFNWKYSGLEFDIALHTGTVIAILAFFSRDWIAIIKSVVKSQSAKSDYPKNLLWQIIVATIPAGIAGYLISGYVEKVFHSPIILSLNLAIFGLILYLVDRFAKKNVNLSSIGYAQSFIVGLAQCLALVPGISCSGITMVASRSLGLEREKAARFSFLLGTPAMLGAFIFDLKDISLGSLGAPFILGVISSAIFGLLAIKYLLEYLKRGNFSVFMWYRIVLAVLVLGIYLFR